MRDPELEAAKQAIADDAGAERGNDITGEAPDEKTPSEDGGRKGETPSQESVRQANAAGADPAQA